MLHLGDSDFDDADYVGRHVQESRRNIFKVATSITDARAAGHPTASGELALSAMITAQAIMLGHRRLARNKAARANHH